MICCKSTFNQLSNRQEDPQYSGLYAKRTFLKVKCGSTHFPHPYSVSPLLKTAPCSEVEGVGKKRRLSSFSGLRTWATSRDRSSHTASDWNPTSNPQSWFYFNEKHVLRKHLGLLLQIFEDLCVFFFFLPSKTWLLVIFPYNLCFLWLIVYCNSWHILWCYYKI